MASINEQAGGRGNNDNRMSLSESLGHRMLPSVSEKEDWRMDDGGEQETESCSLEKLVDSFPGSGYLFQTLMPWPLTMNPWGDCNCQTKFHQALCGALDFASVGVTV